MKWVTTALRLPTIFLTLASLDLAAQSMISVTASNATGELVRPTNFFVRSLFNGSNIVIVPTNSGLGWGARIHNMGGGVTSWTNAYQPANIWLTNISGSGAVTAAVAGAGLDLEVVDGTLYITNTGSASDTSWSNAYQPANVIFSNAVGTGIITNDAWTAGFQANSNRIDTATNDCYSYTRAVSNTLYAVSSNISLALGGAAMEAATNFTVSATNDAYAYSRSVSNSLYGVSSNISVAMANGAMEAATNYAIAATNDCFSYVRSVSNTTYTVSSNIALALGSAALQAATNFTISATNGKVAAAVSADSAATATSASDYSPGGTIETAFGDVVVTCTNYSDAGFVANSNRINTTQAGGPTLTNLAGTGAVTNRNGSVSLALASARLPTNNTMILDWNVGTTYAPQLIGTTNTTAYWTFNAPMDYVSNTLSLSIDWAMMTGVTNTCVWGASVMCQKSDGTTDQTAASFATEVTGEGAVPGTVGANTNMVISLAGNTDTLVAGDLCVLQLRSAIWHTNRPVIRGLQLRYTRQ